MTIRLTQHNLIVRNDSTWQGLLFVSDLTHSAAYCLILGTACFAAIANMWLRSWQLILDVLQGVIWVSTKQRATIAFGILSCSSTCSIVSHFICISVPKHILAWPSQLDFTGCSGLSSLFLKMLARYTRAFQLWSQRHRADSQLSFQSLTTTKLEVRKPSHGILDLASSCYRKSQLSETLQGLW